MSASVATEFGLEDASRAHASVPSRLPWRVPSAFTLFALGSFGVYAVFAYLLAIQDHVFIGDAISRMANTEYVLYSRNPHLAAVGFFWPPLQNFAEIPFMLVLRPLHLALWSGGLTTAIGGTACIVLWKRIFGQLGLPPVLAGILLILWAFNPWILLYSSNGMVDIFLLTCELATMSFLLSWAETGSPAMLLSAGVVCGLAFGFRYESVPLAVAGALYIGVVWAAKYRGDFDRLEGEALAFVSPIVYAAAIWVFANWLLEGSPLHFLSVYTSGYPTVLINGKVQPVAASPSSAVHMAYHSLVGSAEYILLRSEYYFPAVAVMGVAAIIVGVMRRRVMTLVILVMPLAVLAFQMSGLYGGTVIGLFRYFSSSLLVGFFLSAFLLVQLRGWRARRTVTTAGIVLVLVAAALSVPSTGYWMTQTFSQNDESRFVQALEGKQDSFAAADRWGADREMARYIDSLHLHPGSILTDTTTSYAVFAYSERPTVFVIPSDYDFQGLFAELPTLHTYVLVTTRSSPVSLLFTQTYPDLLKGRATWARLEKKIGPWALYRVK